MAATGGYDGAIMRPYKKELFVIFDRLRVFVVPSLEDARWR